MGSFEQSTLPLLPLRGLVVYPTMVLHLDVARDRSVKSLEYAMSRDEHLIVLSTQKKANVESPDKSDIHSTGTLVKIKQMLKLPNGTVRILVEGISRALIKSFRNNNDCYEVDFEVVKDSYKELDLELKALRRSLVESFEKYVQLTAKVHSDIHSTISDLEDPARVADMVASQLPLSVNDKQKVLETINVNERLEKLLEYVNQESEILSLEKKINIRVKKQMEKMQKEYFLREQMKAIQHELGDKDSRVQEVEELKAKLGNLVVPEETKEKILKEINRLERLPTNNTEGAVIRSYIDLLLELPWGVTTKDNLSIVNAEKILNKEHFGLERVKERILEHLAVKQMVKEVKSTILCLVGPPGVGKTSLASSIAEALNRKFVRVSLGGVKDEADIRGHRRAYVGSMPGKIIQSMKHSKTSNPVFLLDEIDKVSLDNRGDPAAALLEVLDPHQNATFVDHYVEIPYDLSQVMFIATANTKHNIPGPLLDRMEIIYLSGYTELEKQEIAKRHLIPNQLRDHGLKSSQLVIRGQALTKIIRNYTLEAGVRNLNRAISSICRKAVTRILKGLKKKIVVTPNTLENFLGQEKVRTKLRLDLNQIGIATGLAWTEMGGDTLSIEVSLLPGKGNITLTGKLGDVMKESARAAVSYTRSKSLELGIDTKLHNTFDIHIHVPEGAIPKDGPSAGITIATALVSSFLDIPVRSNVGMTGEITLRGNILPIGGLKEKVLAAHRTGIEHIILPSANEGDLKQIPKSIRDDLKFSLVSHMSDVLKVSLMREENADKKDRVCN